MALQLGEECLALNRASHFNDHLTQNAMPAHASSYNLIPIACITDQSRKGLIPSIANVTSRSTMTYELRILAQHSF